MEEDKRSERNEVQVKEQVGGLGAGSWKGGSRVAPQPQKRAVLSRLGRNVKPQISKSKSRWKLWADSAELRLRWKGAGREERGWRKRKMGCPRKGKSGSAGWRKAHTRFCASVGSVNGCTYYILSRCGWNLEAITVFLPYQVIMRKRSLIASHS